MRLISNPQGGNNVEEEVIWEPLGNTYTPFEVGGYEDDIFDDRAGIRVDRIGLQEPDALKTADGPLAGSGGNPFDARIEENKNIVSDNGYWIFNPNAPTGQHPHGVRMSLPESSVLSSATLEQGSPVTKWHLVTGNTRLLVSKNGAAFAMSGLGAKAGQAPMAVTRQGWFASNREFRANGRWLPLKNLLGGVPPEDAELLGMLDTGLGVARLTYPNAVIKTVLIAPVQVDDDDPATGVDKSSVLARNTDLGCQKDFWIMAPSGTRAPGEDCQNQTTIHIPIKPDIAMHISSPGGEVQSDPEDLSLGDPENVVWHGNANSTVEPPMSWSIGRTGQESTRSADLPVKVMVMKRRTVKVAAIKVQRPGARTFPTRDWSKISEELERVYPGQINATFTMDMLDATISYDSNGNGYLVSYDLPIPGVSDEYESLLNDASTQASRATHDITVLLIDDIHFYFGIGLPSQDLTNQGHTRPANNTCVVGVGLRHPQSGGYSIEERSVDQIANTIAHEIGHVLIGSAFRKHHPDENGGPAPFLSLGLAHQKERILCSGANRNPGARLLVKAEWDRAEQWLKNRPNGDN